MKSLALRRRLELGASYKLASFACANGKRQGLTSFMMSLSCSWAFSRAFKYLRNSPVSLSLATMLPTCSDPHVHESSPHVQLLSYPCTGNA